MVFSSRCFFSSFFKGTPIFLRQKVVTKTLPACLQKACRMLFPKAPAKQRSGAAYLNSGASSLPRGHLRMDSEDQDEGW